MGPSQFHTPSVQHIGSTQMGHSFSAPKIPQFHTPLSSTPKTPQFNTKNPSIPHAPQFHTKNPSVPHTHQTKNSSIQVWKWGVLGIELRGFWCGTERCVELRRAIHLKLDLFIFLAWRDRGLWDTSKSANSSEHKFLICSKVPKRLGE